MVARIRNNTWECVACEYSRLSLAPATTSDERRLYSQARECDEEFKRDLEGYVKQALKRDEVLDFVSKKFEKNIQCMLGVCVLIVVVCITLI